MSTESDLAAARLSEPLASENPFRGRAVPIKPLRVGVALLSGTGLVGAVRGLFGSPGEVGGRASRAELTECALRLCAERGGATCAWGERTLVMVIVTERGSPAK
jgi:hypothetical protein